VTSAVDGASCGLELRLGQRVGLLLDVQGREYSSSLCRQVDPNMLLGYAPGQDARTWPFALAGGVGLVLAAVGAALAFRRR
jgi:hypothetical protein